MKRAVGIAATAVLFLLFAVACGETLPPQDTVAPILYPGAASVITSEVQLPWRIPDITVYRTIAFHADDPPESVLTFYKANLLKNGWALSGCQGITNTLTVVWQQAWSTGVYVVEVAAGLSGEQNSELRFGRLDLASDVGMSTAENQQQEIQAKYPKVYECLGVSQGGLDSWFLPLSLTAIVMGMILALHAFLSAVAWQARFPLSILLLILAYIVITGLWVVVGTNINLILLISHFSGVGASALRAERPDTVVATILSELPHRQPGPYLLMLIVCSFLGIILRKPIIRLRQSLRRPSRRTETV